MLEITRPSLVINHRQNRCWGGNILYYGRRTVAEEHQADIQRWECMQKIFISYSRKDMDFGRKLAGDLEKAGYDVWWDISDLRGGDDWIKVIPAAIESSQFILVVLSPNSVQSEWVQKEYTQALNLRKKIIPIMFEATGVPFALNTLNFLNFSAGKYEENYKNLLSALGYSGEPPAVTTFIKSRLTQLPGLRKYAIPIGIVVLAILLLIAFEATRPPVAVPPTFTPTNTSEPATVTPSATLTDTPISTKTPTLTSTKPTSTPTSTSQLFQSLRLCLNVAADVNNINVRSGPGTNYARLGEPLDIDSCLRFNAINEEGSWVQVALNQNETANQQYAGGWIRSDLFGLTGPIDLPMVTLTPTPTRTASATITLTFTQTLSPTPSDTPAVTSSDTPTFTSTATETGTPVPTETPPP